MFEDKGSPCKLFDLDVENLKVVEIKKRLKQLGLSVTGNKSELVERLQEAMISGKESRVESSSIDIVMPDSPDGSSTNKLSDQLLDENLSSPLKDRELSQETQDQTVSSAAAAAAAAAAPVPLKKRVVVQADDETGKPKKRFVINRNNVPTPKLFVHDEPSKVVSHIKIDMEKNEETKAMESGDELLGQSGSIKNVISLGTKPKTVLSETERAIMRAKRFNMAVEAPKPQKPMDPVKRMQIMQWKSNVAASTPLAPVPNLEILKKRAERFGENVSDVLKQLEDQEKINKRKSKFGHDIGDIKAPGSEEQAKKNKRAERFRN